MIRATSCLVLVLALAFVCVVFDPEVFAKGDVRVVYEPMVAHLPSCQIADRIQKISILGSGPGADQRESSLTKLFMDRTEIRVVEPANLRSAMTGKIIEYRTGIAPEDAQALSQLLQIDHLVLFDIETAPHSAYRFGGRFYARMSLKIVNTLSGEVVFQSSRNVGSAIDDPRKYGYAQASELDSSLLRNAIAFSLDYELRYALGDTMLGWITKSGTNIVGALLVGCVADRAGIRPGDAIVGLNDTKISSGQDIASFFPKGRFKQGDEVLVKVERDGKIMECRVKFPVIPFRKGTGVDRLGAQGPEQDPGERSSGDRYF
jgi:hypothetical protein